MGCDGGTIPRRDELVKTKKKPEQVDKDAEITAKWKHCSISQEELVTPIMACELGRLYNKDSVITHILEKGQNSNENVQHIRGLKDVTELKLTENPAYDNQGPDKGDKYIDRQASKYICPVVGLEMNGKYRFCFLRECGCVMSEKALKAVKSETCHKCGRSFIGDDDIILLNGSEQETEDLRDKMTERRARAKLEKKAKKGQKHSSTEISGADSVVFDSKKIKLENEKPSGSKLKLSADLPSTSGSSSSKGKQRATTSGGKQPTDKSSASYSVAKDPNVSEAFKSLFTSHETFKNQPKAHWITHNPLFY